MPNCLLKVAAMVISRLTRFAAALALIVLFATSARAQQDGGVYVRLLDIRVEPDDAMEWEAAVEAIAGAARESSAEFCCDWLLYRQGSFRYRVVFFSDGLGDLVTPEVFANAIAGTPGEDSFRKAVQQLQATRYEVVDDVVHQKIQAWSTVEEMSTATHPKGHLTKYWVRPGAEKAFDAAMRDQTALLKDVAYPYPLEGFQWRVGSPGVNYVVIFPDAWPAFLGEHAVRAVMQRRGREADYQALLDRIAATVYRVEQQDIDFDASLSY
jgi:hypothetical protein